jgi:hypothetical protein
MQQVPHPNPWFLPQVPPVKPATSAYLQMDAHRNLHATRYILETNRRTVALLRRAPCKLWREALSTWSSSTYDLNPSGSNSS